MFYSIIAVTFFATIALSLETVPIYDQERNVLVRFYSNFAQLYRPANLKSYVDQDQTIEQYQFFFPEREYIQIVEESLTMFHTNVIDRTITFHPMPVFAVNGSRYFYRRNPKQDLAVEIELINPKDRIFREVNQPDRYFYLPATADLEYSSQVPVMPYYEVIFTCNTSSSEKQPPTLSYIDRSFQYTLRYLLDVPPVVNNKPMEIRAFADIRNTGELPIVIKGAELVAGHIPLNRRLSDYFRTAVAYETFQHETSNMIRSLGEKASGTVIYQLSLPTSAVIPAHSLKSIQLLDARVVVESFLYYSSLFTPVNSNGKLLTAYNLTSIDSFLPSGRILLREQGRFIGEMNVPDIPVNSTYTMIFDADADASYRREVTVLSEEETSDSMAYRVEYVFENVKPLNDVQVYFSESFNSFKFFQIENLFRPANDVDLLNIELRGPNLRGYFTLPCQGSPTIISYKLRIFKDQSRIRRL